MYKLTWRFLDKEYFNEVPHEFKFVQNLGMLSIFFGFVTSNSVAGFFRPTVELFLTVADNRTVLTRNPN